MPKVSTAQTAMETRASRRVRDIVDLAVGSVDDGGAESYFKPEWAVAGSHVIEPTGPMMGPNAVADVMPLGGRQMLWRGRRAFSLGFNNPSRCCSAPTPIFGSAFLLGIGS